MSRLEHPGYDLVGIRADNPGPLTLSGTNTWIYGRDPAWLIDPGPALAAHVEAISDELDARGGLAAVLLTHDHSDHAEAVSEIVRRFSPVPLAAARGTVSMLLRDRDRCGPFEVLAIPGHAPDHLAYVSLDGIAFTGDAVLGTGSVLVVGQLAAYLAALGALRTRRLSLIAPGHGPIVAEPDDKLSDYIEHRRTREAALIRALVAGKRTTEELLDAAWPDVPAELRPVAALTLEAHLEKLSEEGRLPPGVERGGGSAGPPPQ